MDGSSLYERWRSWRLSERAFSGLPISCATPAARSITARDAPALSSSSVRAFSAVMSRTYTIVSPSKGMVCISSARLSGYVTAISRFEDLPSGRPSVGSISSGGTPRSSRAAGLACTTCPSASSLTSPSFSALKRVSERSSASATRPNCSLSRSASILPMCLRTLLKNSFTVQHPLMCLRNIIPKLRHRL